MKFSRLSADRMIVTALSILRQATNRLRFDRLRQPSASSSASSASSPSLYDPRRFGSVCAAPSRWAPSSSPIDHPDAPHCRSDKAPRLSRPRTRAARAYPQPRSARTHSLERRASCTALLWGDASYPQARSFSPSMSEATVSRALARCIWLPSMTISGGRGRLL